MATKFPIIRPISWWAVIVQLALICLFALIIGFLFAVKEPGLAILVTYAIYRIYRMMRLRLTGEHRGVIALLFPTKTIEVSHGEFVCPRCQRMTTFKHKERVRVKYHDFLAFLGDTIGEYIECQTCSQRFPLDALRTKLSPDIAQVLDTLKDKLQSGASLEETETNLLNAGIDPSTVKRYVSVAAGIGLKRCPQCSLTFRDEVIKCNKCGHVLPRQNA